MNFWILLLIVAALSYFFPVESNWLLSVGAIVGVLFWFFGSISQQNRFYENRYEFYEEAHKEKSKRDREELEKQTR